MKVNSQIKLWSNSNWKCCSIESMDGNLLTVLEQPIKDFGSEGTQDITQKIYHDWLSLVHHINIVIIYLILFLFSVPLMKLLRSLWWTGVILQRWGLSVQHQRSALWILLKSLLHFRRLQSSQPASSTLHKCVCECVFVSTREREDRNQNHCAHMIVRLGISRWPKGKYISVWETQSRRQRVWEKAFGLYTITSPLPVSPKKSAGHAWLPLTHARAYTHTHTDSDTTRFIPVWRTYHN